MCNVHIRSRFRGFSLVELAIGLVILALLTGGALAAFRVQAQRSRFIEAREQVKEAQEALLNAAAVDGVLLCPDTDTPADGRSNNGEDGQSNSCAAAVTGVVRGLLPWSDLALPSADPWGQSLRYAVHSSYATPGSISLAKPTHTGMRVVSQQLDGSNEDLANPLSIAMLVWSAGPDGVDITPAPTNNPIVVQSPEGDDIPHWLSRFLLIGRMLEAGRDVPDSPVVAPPPPASGSSSGIGGNGS